jgi:hypothetical protein
MLRRSKGMTSQSAQLPLVSDPVDPYIGCPPPLVRGQYVVTLRKMTEKVLTLVRNVLTLTKHLLMLIERFMTVTIVDIAKTGNMISKFGAADWLASTKPTFRPAHRRVGLQL